MSDLSVSTSPLMSSSIESSSNSSGTKISVKNASTTITTNTENTQFSFMVVYPKDFRLYVDTLMSTDQHKRLFVNIKLSRNPGTTSYLLEPDQILTFKGQHFIDLSLVGINFPAGTVMKNCTLEAQDRYMQWGEVSFTDSDLEAVKIEGNWHGRQSFFSGFTLHSVNMKKATLHDIKFSSGDGSYMLNVNLYSADLKNISFLGHKGTTYQISEVDLRHAKITGLEMGYVCCKEKVYITGAGIGQLMLSGPCDLSGWVCKNYQPRAITWNPEMFSDADALKKAFCHKQGAIVINALDTLKKNNSDIVVDLVEQMVAIIRKYPESLATCLESDSIRLPLVEMLRDPCFANNQKIQAFRNTLLYRHYQRVPLRLAAADITEAAGMIKTLPLEQLLPIQLVVNQLAQQQPGIRKEFSRIKGLAKIVEYLKTHYGPFPHIFVNRGTQEALCLTEEDFTQLVTRLKTPEAVRLVKFDHAKQKFATLPATPENIAAILTHFPLLDSLWKRSVFTLRPAIEFLFSDLSGLNNQSEAMQAYGIQQHLISLLVRPGGKKMDLATEPSHGILERSFAAFSGTASQQHCEELVRRVQRQLQNHPGYHARPGDQQQAIAALVMLKLLIELSTAEYCGKEAVCAEGLTGPALDLFVYARIKCPTMFTIEAKERWRSYFALGALRDPLDAQAFLSRLDRYEFPGSEGPAIRTVFNEVYPLP